MGILEVATGSLQVFQRALASTSNNIVNAGTEGYTRQRANLVTQGSTRMSGGYVGNGVRYLGIDRVTDEFAVLQYRSALSESSLSTSFRDLALVTDALLSGSATDLSVATSDFFSNLQALVDDPSSLPQRQSFFSEAELMSTSYQRMYDELERQSRAVDGTIRTTVDEINTLAGSIADLNVLLVGNTSGAPDLLDQRDRLLAELSKKVQITTIEQDDGTYFVSVGNGQVLVSGATVNEMSVTRNQFNPTRLDIVMAGSSVVTNQLSGGELGGFLDYRSDVIDPAENRLGRVAIALADNFNTQHRMGVDADGNMGGYFFKDINNAAVASARALSSASNTGTLDLNVTITDSSMLTTSDYRLDYDGANYTLRRLSDNTNQVFGALPAVSADGFSINLNAGAPAAGDSFLIVPTKFGAQDLDIVAPGVNSLAMGQPIRTTHPTTNIGNGKITAGIMDDRATYLATGQPDLPLTIEFTAANTYEIRDGANNVLHAGIPYDPTQLNSLFPSPAPTSYDPGFRVELSGMPEVGDTFVIEANTGGANDSRNALALARISNQALIENGRFNLQEAYGETVSYVGNKARQADVNAEASEVLLAQAKDRIASTSEVNLEEEAANLLKFQQLFTAATQIISTVSNIFDILANALNR